MVTWLLLKRGIWKVLEEQSKGVYRVEKEEEGGGGRVRGVKSLIKKHEWRWYHFFKTCKIWKLKDTMNWKSWLWDHVWINNNENMKNDWKQLGLEKTSNLSEDFMHICQTWRYNVYPRIRSIYFPLSQDNNPPDIQNEGHALQSWCYGWWVWKFLYWKSLAIMVPVHASIICTNYNWNDHNPQTKGCLKMPSGWNSLCSINYVQQ